MGDFTAMHMVIPSPPPDLVAHLDELFNEYGSESYIERDGFFIWESGDVRCGSAMDLAGDLDTLKTDGYEGDCPQCSGSGEVRVDHEGMRPCVRCNGNGTITVYADLAYEVYEEPKYEWLGDLHWYTPWLGGYAAECDADGTPAIGPAPLIEAVDKASTLDEAREQISKLTGRAFAPVFTISEAGEQRKVKLRRVKERTDEGLSVERYTHTPVDVS